jgi:hypothetical protein
MRFFVVAFVSIINVVVIIANCCWNRGQISQALLYIGYYNRTQSFHMTRMWYGRKIVEEECYLYSVLILIDL